MVSDINIEEVIEDKSSEFNIRKFSIGDTHFQKPEKSLDASTLKKGTYDLIKSKFKFREGARLINNYQTISNVVSKYDDSQIQQFFFKNTWSELPIAINYTLNFNPFETIKKIEEMRPFFDLYYPYSELFLTVPNIRVEKYFKISDDKGYYRRIISFEDYTKFVDQVYNLLDTKNNKHIFVPISFRMKLGEIKDLISYYLKKQYYYYWIDFDGKTINQTRIGELRHIYNIIRNAGVYDKTVSYFTNIKREINVNAKNDSSEASDVLSTVTGANLIGVNREPKRVMKKPPPTPITPNNYKSRLLNINTYYYIKTNDPNQYPKNVYAPSNAVTLNREFNNQTDYFLANLDLKNYLNKKEMLTKYHNGDLLKILTSKQSQVRVKDLKDYFQKNDP